MLIGVQLVLTLVILSILNKISPKYSISRWLLSNGLIRYLHPTDEWLREMVGLPKTSTKANKHRKERSTTSNDNTFNVPRNIRLCLDSEFIKIEDVIELPYYTELQWLIDFAFSAIIVYTCTEFYFFIFANSAEYNLSVVWCSLVLLFSVIAAKIVILDVIRTTCDDHKKIVRKVLFSITAVYFSGGDESIGERSICIVSGCVFFLVAMIVLITDENILEFGLNTAYSSFNSSAFKLLEAHGMIENAYGPITALMFKLWLAVWCALIGTFFIFPGLRLAKMHIDALTYNQSNYRVQFLLHLSFISPLLIMLMWFKPIAREYLTVRKWSNKETTLLNNDSFETTRIIIIIMVITLRIILIRRYLQSYLNIAPQKLTLLKKESGRITNIDLQKLIARVFYYLCVVTLQYIAPLLICLFTTLLMKTLGNYSWKGSVFELETNSASMFDNSTLKGPQFTLFMLKNVFNAVVLRGIMGFMVWWITSVWFTTSVVGFVYHTYFT